MTMFRSAFSYLDSIILRILQVEFIALSDLRHSLTYDLINDFSSSFFLSVVYVKS